MSFRHFVLVTHRWLGLGSSVVLAIVGGTGALILWTLPQWLRRIVGPMHQSLALGRIGEWIVIAVTVVAAVLSLGGLILWWKLKLIRVKTTSGWRRALFDLHHVLGVVGFLLMFLLTVSGIGIVLTKPDSGEFRRIIFNLHTTRGFPFWLKVIWALGSAAFVVQVLSGVVMWWKPRPTTSNRRSRKVEAGIGAALMLLLGCVGARSASSVITLNPSTTLQTMTGWETVMMSTVRDYTPFLPVLDKVLRDSANDLGITRVRIPIPSGTEHPPGYASQYINGEISEGTLMQKFAYDIVNDNADPNVADLKAFDFGLVDWRMENMVLPLKKHVEARGQKLYSYVSYVDFGSSGFEHYAHPDEYAEFMLVLFDHLKSKYDFVPDGIDVVNEPDNIREGWTGTAMGNVIAKTGPRLAAAGYKPDFVIPSTMDRGRAVPYFDEAMTVPGAREYVKEISFHCYADTGSRSLETIAQRAVQYNVSVVQDECWRDANTYQTLHEDLKAGRASAWQQGGLIGMHAYYDVNPSSMQVTLSPKTRLMRQYYKYVRPGARRIQADTTNGALDPIAFINSDNQYVVVIKAESAGDFTIQNLPAGTYGVFYTTFVEFDAQGANIDVEAGQPLKASIPAAGVITIYGKQE